MISLKRLLLLIICLALLPSAFTSCDASNDNGTVNSALSKPPKGNNISQSSNEETVTSHEHKFDEWEITKEADCATPGTRVRVCECGETNTESIPIIEHIWKDATCDAPKTCTICGIADGESIGHIWIDATCESPKTCTICGIADGESIGHVWIDATCESPKTCTVCSIIEGEKNSHEFVDGVCILCEYEDPACKEYKIGEEIFYKLISIGATAEEIGNYVYEAWYFYVYEADDVFVLSDGVSEFVGATGLNSEHVEQAIIEYITLMGYEESDITSILKLAVFRTLDGCLYVANRSCELAGITEGIASELDDIKNQLKLMSNDYESTTGVSVLKNMYSDVSDYYYFVNNPSGTFNTFNTKRQNYTSKIVDSINELEFIYE